jgi:teichuronic acid biosynthesis glycosyltransferase TuaH
MDQNKNQQYDIIMFNMSSFTEWNRGVSNRNFHIIDHLKNNPQINKILAIDYLPHTWKRFFRNWYENIISSPNSKTLKLSFFTRIYQPDKKIIVYSTIKNKFSTKRALKSINKYAQKENFKNIILWSSYPLITEYFDEINHDISVFDTVDNWCEHASYKKFWPKLKKNYEIIRDKAKLIFILAKNSEKIFHPRQEKIFQITQGIDLGHYQIQNKLINKDIAQIPKPIIGYVGVIQENRIYMDLIEHIAKKNPDKSIVMIGPIWRKEDDERLRQYSNIYLLGAKTYHEIHNYINQFDVGIIPHLVNEFIKYTCPMKLYEYMACGIPIVTTDAPGVEQFKDYIKITNDFNKFNKFINEELENDSPEKREARLQIIKEHTWAKKIDQMLNYINEKI